MKKRFTILAFILALILLAGCDVIGQPEETEPISNLVSSDPSGFDNPGSSFTEAVGGLVEVPGRVYYVYWEEVGNSIGEDGTSGLYLLDPSDLPLYRFTQEDLDGAISVAEKKALEYIEQACEHSISEDFTEGHIVRVALNPEHSDFAISEAMGSHTEWAEENRLEASQPRLKAMGSHTEWAEENYYSHWISLDVTIEFTLAPSRSGPISNTLPQETAQVLLCFTLYRDNATVSDMWRISAYYRDTPYAFLQEQGETGAGSFRTFLSQDELAAYIYLGGEPVMGYYVPENNSYRIYIYDEEQDQIFCHILRETSHEIYGSNEQ